MQLYVVKPNDTLFLIAKEFGVPLAQLIQANPQISDPNMIDIGQTITIPDLPEVPEQIRIIEAAAIDTINDVILSDWESAMRRVDQIRTAVNDVTPALREALVPNNVIFGLNTAVRNVEQNLLQRRAFPAISQANRITQLIADALDYFNVIIPTDLLRLAYFSRQIIVNVEQNDWPEAYQNYRRMINVWERLSPELTPEYQEDVDAVNQALDNLNAAIDRRDYQAAINGAGRILELVNTIARDFEQLST